MANPKLPPNPEGELIFISNNIKIIPPNGKICQLCESPHPSFKIVSGVDVKRFPRNTPTSFPGLGTTWCGSFQSTDSKFYSGSGLGGGTMIRFDFRSRCGSWDFRTYGHTYIGGGDGRFTYGDQCWAFFFFFWNCDFIRWDEKFHRDLEFRFRGTGLWVPPLFTTYREDDWMWWQVFSGFLECTSFLKWFVIHSKWAIRAEL